MSRVRGSASARFTDLSALVRRLLPRWVELESLALKNCLVFCAGETRPSFTSSLVSVRLINFQQTMWTTDSILFYLPAGMNDLVLESRDFFATSAWNVGQGIDGNARFLNLSEKLEHVSILDGRGWRATNAEDKRRTRRRGALDNFLAKLENVVDLTVTPVAISDLKTLTQLKKLERFELVDGQWEPTSAVPAGEVVDLLTDSTSLKEVKMSTALAATWSDQDKQDVRDAAEPNIAFVWI